MSGNSASPHMSAFDRFFEIPELDPAVQKSFRREQLSELTLPLATSLMEGGFVAVVAAKAFNVQPWVIAVISAAPMFGNLSWWLALGRVITGIVNGGGNLAWQLGHNDFAPRDQIATYMGIHVTLTGVRGAFAPFLGMALYLGWDAQGYVPGSTGLSAWLFLLSALLGVVAWRGFDTLRKDVRQRPLNR